MKGEGCAHAPVASLYRAIVTSCHRTMRFLSLRFIWIGGLWFYNYFYSIKLSIRSSVPVTNSCGVGKCRAAIAFINTKVVGWHLTVIIKLNWYWHLKTEKSFQSLLNKAFYCTPPHVSIYWLTLRCGQKNLQAKRNVKDTFVNAIETSAFLIRFVKGQLAYLK